MANLGNIASQRVLEKIGLERRGERAFSHPAYAAEGPMAWFERDAESWRTAHDRNSEDSGQDMAQGQARSSS
jgi:hypothetical protein